MQGPESFQQNVGWSHRRSWHRRKWSNKSQRIHKIHVKTRMNKHLFLIEIYDIYFFRNKYLLLICFLNLKIDYGVREFKRCR